MNDLTAEIESLNQWKGHEERVEEILSPLKVEGYHAVLDNGEPSVNEGTCTAGDSLDACPQQYSSLATWS